MSKKLQEQLEEFVRGKATDGSALCEIFYRASKEARNVPECWNIQVPKEVYDQYWDLHEASLRLVDALERVLDDPEHQLIMEEAAGQGYRLPELGIFRQELSSYREALHEFDPYRAKEAVNGYVSIPAKTAEMLHNLIRYNCFMVARIFDGCFNTDYMKHFGFYKNSGFPYAGPTALQETLDVLIGMARTVNEIDKQVKNGRQRTDWPKLLPNCKL